MKRTIKLLAMGSLIGASSLYAASVAACAGCHGQHFEKKAMGVSKVVKDMSKADIVAALKGYKAGTYGGAMKGIMAGQVKSLGDADIEAIAGMIKGGIGTPTHVATAHAAAAAAAAADVIDINAKVCDPKRIEKEDLGNKKEVDETVLGLRKASLDDEEKIAPPAVKEDRPAPGAAPRFARSYVNAPPLIPHSVEGLLPITKNNNQCLGCHMPDQAKAVGATPIPPSHFTDYRPETVLKNGELVKEGKVVGLKGDIGNVGDIKLAKKKKLNHLYQGRFNCSQCHVPQANIEPVVANTFKPDGLVGDLKAKSNLADVIDEGVE